MDKAFRLSLEMTPSKIKMKMVLRYLLLKDPQLEIYLQQCGRTLMFFTQMQRLELFLPQVLLLHIKRPKRFLVRSNFYLLERAVGSSKCGFKRLKQMARTLQDGNVLACDA